MGPISWVILYCLLIVCSSLAGGWLPSVLRLTHTRMQLIVSFVGGLMLGVGLFHLLPHSTVFTESLDQTVWWMVIGLLTTFFLIRLFDFHQHGAAEAGLNAGHGQLVHNRASREAFPHEVAAARYHFDNSISWLGVAIGLGIHTLIDGLALGAAVVAEAEGRPILPGVGIFLVVLLHKPLDALSITSLMAAAGWSIRAGQLVNVTFALMCPLGALLFALGVGNQQNVLIGCALGFAAGVFACISLGDLLPELHFHSHDRLKLSALLLLGISAAYAITFVEPNLHKDPSHSATHASPLHTHRTPSPKSLP